MKSIENIGLTNVKEVYSGPEGALWELIMGAQIHIGGFASSMDLAKRAEIAIGQTGVDFCSCNGAGVRFLLRFIGASNMVGVDATELVTKQAKERTEAEGLSEKAEFILADVTDTNLENDKFDFAWGEDAWCYVEDKPKLINEAVRVVKPGGTIAFTDWVEGATPMTDEEATRFLSFMKFPNLEDIGGYKKLLEDSGAEVKIAEATGRYSKCIDLYLDMLNLQLTSDALKIIGYDMEMITMLGGEMQFIQKLAHEGKIVQGIFVAKVK